jgi:hypothetical protein
VSERIDAEYLREPDSSDADPKPGDGQEPIVPNADPAPDADEGEPDFGGTQVSQGASSLQNAETSAGGADGVPDTPDDVAEPYVSDTDATHRQG